MAHKAKILARLSEKFKGLSKQFLGLWADKLDPKVTEEKDIEGVVDELDKLPITLPELAAEFQKEADRRVTEAKKEFEKKNPPKKEESKTEDPDEEEDDPEEEQIQKPAAGTPKKKKDRTPEWAKSLMAEVQSLKTEKAQNTIKGKITEQLKDVPVKFYGKWKFPEKEEDIEAFVEEVKTDYAEFQPSETQAQETKPGFTPPPKTGSGSTNGAVKPSDKELDEIMKKI